MQWKGRRTSTNVEDRRGASGGGFSGLGGGLGSLLGGLLGGGSSGGGKTGCGLCGGIGTIIILLLAWKLGFNPLQLLGSLDGLDGTQTTDVSGGYQQSAEDDEMAEFVKVVLAETEDVWTEQFNKMGKTYRKPTLVLFNGYTSSGCGAAQSSTGPFYCPSDEKIYVDLSFFDEMKTQLNAGGDFAYAYVIAHEVGHHVQKLLGTLDRTDQQRARSSEKESNAISVRVELQADFYAGVWAYHSKYNLQLDTEDINEALNAANQIGDDRLQQQAQGYTVPDSFTHGTSQQRHDWFYKGYKTGDVSQGNTFQSTL